MRFFRAVKLGVPREFLVVSCQLSVLSSQFPVLSLQFLVLLLSSPSQFSFSVLPAVISPPPLSSRPRASARVEGPCVSAKSHLLRHVPGASGSDGGSFLHWPLAKCPHAKRIREL